MRIGVLALQGNFREHLALLARLGVDGSEVRLPEQLDGLDALVLPGGESTSIGKLMRIYGLDRAIAAFERPILGTCAGMIVLARDAVDGVPDQVQLGLIDLTVRRNGFGRQVHSFEADVELVGDATPLRGVFIRAPRAERVGDGVQVLARLGGEPVLLGEGRVLVASFHPELAGDTRVHERLVALAAGAEAAKEGSVGRP